MRVLILLCLLAFALPGRAFSQPVGVSCWIVGTGQGGAPRSFTSVSNDVQALNRFFPTGGNVLRHRVRHSDK